MQRTFIDIKRFKKFINGEANSHHLGKEVVQKIKQRTHGITDPLKIERALDEMISEADQTGDFNQGRIAVRWKAFLNLSQLKHLLPPGEAIFLDEYENHTGHVYVIRDGFQCIDDLLVKCLGWERGSVNGKQGIKFPVRAQGKVSETAMSISRDLYGDDARISTGTIHRPDIYL